MDFTFSEEQQAVQQLARQILEDRVSVERLREIEAGQEWFDRDTWAALATAGLLGAALPEDVGGSAVGIMGLGLLLEEQGRTVAPLPLIPTLVGALPIDRYGTSAQRKKWLPGVANGEVILTTALEELVNDDPTRPKTKARAEDFDSGYLVNGTKICVEYATQANRILVPASIGRGVVLLLVDPKAKGVTLSPERSTRREPIHTLTMKNVKVPKAGVIGTPKNGREIVTFLRDRMMAAICAVQLGITEKALQLTAQYTSQREQFGRPIATFQAVAQRAADAFINVEGIRLTTWQALWRLDSGLDATDEITIAKYWASDGAQQVAHATQHLHGGIGVDVDYPLHRYTLWNKQLELSLGAGTTQMRRLGASIAAAAMA